MLTIPCQITATSIDDGLLTLEFTPWLNTSTRVRIPVAIADKAKNADGQRLLARICRAVGFTTLADERQLVGKTLTLKLAQPKVAAGIHSAPVVVEVVTC
jgi:hypothetical protein